LYEDNKEYQSTYHSDYDIEEWTPGQFEYELEPCISKKWVTQSIVSAKVNSANKQIEAIQQRRRGLKNHYKKLDN
jgi:hypothetical protein